MCGSSPSLYVRLQLIGFVFMLVVVAKMLPSIDLIQIMKQQRTTEEDRAKFSGVQSTVLLSEFRFERIVN